MKVKDLIQALETLNEEAYVYIEFDDDYIL